MQLGSSEVLTRARSKGKKGVRFELIAFEVLTKPMKDGIAILLAFLSSIVPIAETSADDPAATKQQPADRTNVLFILSEDQGSHLSYLGTPELNTPHIDRLARSGTYFRNAFVAYPVCSASKAAIYTGLHNHQNGLLNNTANYHKPAAALTDAERNRGVYRSNRIVTEAPTLIERLAAAGYRLGVTHKLHVAPVERFPYDEFLSTDPRAAENFIRRSVDSDRPWFLVVNVPDSHRPFPNSDQTDIGIDPAKVKLPGFLPDSPTVRKDWAEYLAAIERVDDIVGRTLATLDATGQRDRTLVIFMSDHGPAFAHGKMTLHDLGLRVPLLFSGPEVRAGGNVESAVSSLDLLPTLIDVLDLPAEPTDPSLEGESLAKLLASGEKPPSKPRLVFSEISNRGPLPNDGIQERSVTDGRYKLIYRERVADGWRQVNADTRDMTPWRNRTYGETVRLRDTFPEPYRALREMDPQTLGGTVPQIEFYDWKHDPEERQDLSGSAAHSETRFRLLEELARWVQRTQDRSITRMDRWLEDPIQAVFPTPATKKGLQVEDVSDAVDLGVHHAALNVIVPGLCADNPVADGWSAPGRLCDYPLQPSAIRRLDKQIGSLSAAGANVYLILLNPVRKNASMPHRASDTSDAMKEPFGEVKWIHPKYDPQCPNRYSAFRVDTPEARDRLDAIIRFLARRYSHVPRSPDGPVHGRVVGYIVGNEVNSHHWWHNRGAVGLDEFVDSYTDEFELISRAVAGVSRWARVYVSLDHHWADSMSPAHPQRCFGSREFLLRFADACRQRNNLPFHVAFHPYPENLRDPTFWEDETALPNDRTPKVTPKNLEVLIDFVRRPEMIVGGHPARIILSEQGFDCPSGEDGEAIQAAAYCLAYHEIDRLEGIDAFILHRHIDHPAEHGLRLGLYGFEPGDRRKASALDARPIRDCFRDAGTDRQSDRFRFALPIVGLKAWPD